VDEQMAVELTKILDSIREQTTNIEKIQTYKAIAKMVLQELDDNSRKEVLEFVEQPVVIEIPENLSVGDVSELLNVTPQMVRRYCSEGKIEAYQTLEGSGKWKIPIEQFKNHPNWNKFIQDKKNVQIYNMKTADIMLEMLARED